MDTKVISVGQSASTADLATDMRNQSENRPAPLFTPEITDRLRESWSSVQAGFVDEPRHAVKEADELVASAIKHIAETFARERENLESQWDREGDVSTEDLRIALTRYRSFFDRLLSM